MTLGGEGVLARDVLQLYIYILYIIQGVSSLRSLSPCSYVCLRGIDDIIIMHLHCTVLYQGP